MKRKIIFSFLFIFFFCFFAFSWRLLTCMFYSILLGCYKDVINIKQERYNNNNNIKKCVPKKYLHSTHTKRIFSQWITMKLVLQHIQRQKRGRKMKMKLLIFVLYYICEWRFFGRKSLIIFFSLFFTNYATFFYIKNSI